MNEPIDKERYMTNGEKYIESLSPDKIIDMIGGYEALAGILKYSCDSCTCCDYQYEDCGGLDCRDGIFSWLKEERDNNTSERRIFNF